MKGNRLYIQDSFITRNQESEAFKQLKQLKKESISHAPAKFSLLLYIVLTICLLNG